jgi:hypothetical protein
VCRVYLRPQLPQLLPQPLRLLFQAMAGGGDVRQRRLACTTRRLKEAAKHDMYRAQAGRQFLCRCTWPPGFSVHRHSSQELLLRQPITRESKPLPTAHRLRGPPTRLLQYAQTLPHVTQVQRIVEPPHHVAWRANNQACRQRQYLKSQQRKRDKETARPGARADNFTTRR